MTATEKIRELKTEASEKEENKNNINVDSPMYIFPVVMAILQHY